MVLFEEKSLDRSLAGVKMGPFITTDLHSFSCIYFLIL